MPDPTKLAKDVKDVGNVLSHLARQAIFFVDPTYKVPYKNQVDLYRNTDFVDEMHARYFPSEERLSNEELYGDGSDSDDDPYALIQRKAALTEAVKINSDRVQATYALTLTCMSKLQHYIAKNRDAWNNVAKVRRFSCATCFNKC